MRPIVHACTALLAIGIAGNAAAVVIDFESVPTGTYSSLTFADLTLTAQNGQSLFDVTSANPGSPIQNHCLTTWFQQETQTPLLATFSVNDVTSFAIGVGDFNQDVDNTWLQVFDASWNLLGTDSYVNPGSTYGGDYLSLSVSTTTLIKYAVFWDAEPYPGAVYWDNLTYERNGQQPVPDVGATGAMLVMALGSLGLLRKRS